MRILIVATRNLHKVQEIRTVLGDGLEYRTLADLADPPVVEERGKDFAENARIKSVTIANWLAATIQEQKSILGAASELSRSAEFRSAHWAVLADDSGLEVDALAGKPGIHSARFAAGDFGLAGNAPDAGNNAKLLRALAGVPSELRTARFRCALAFTRQGPEFTTECFEGTCEGHVGVLPRGAHGFGYDPLFTPRGSTRTFAELGEETKNRLSHRAIALAALKACIDEVFRDVR